MSKSNYLENAILDHIYGGPTLNRPATLYIALSTADPGDDGAGLAEPTGNGYARTAVTNNATNWPAASNGTKQNGTVITFATASAAWSGGANQTHFAIFDAPTGGNMLHKGPLTTPKPVLAGDTPELGVSDITITED